MAITGRFFFLTEEQKNRMDEVLRVYRYEGSGAANAMLRGEPARFQLSAGVEFMFIEKPALMVGGTVIAPFFILQWMARGVETLLRWAGSFF